MRLRSFAFLTFALAVFASCYEKDIEGPEPVDAFSIVTSVPTLTIRQDDTSDSTGSTRRRKTHSS